MLLFNINSYDITLHNAITSAITIDRTKINTINNILSMYGVCIVTGVLDDAECIKLGSGICNDLSWLTQRMTPQFNIDNTDTWSVLDQLLPIDGIIYQHWGLGQSQTIWDVRCNDKVIDVFANIYGTRDLLVSFDAISVSLPGEYHDNKSNRFYSHDRWHFDQSLLKPNFECVQGWVNAFDTNYMDATTAIMIYSNRLHQAYGNLLQQMGKTLEKDDWIKVDDVSFFLSNGCIPYRVEAKKGSIVLWDSRTLHYGSKPLPGRLRPNYRMLAYVCYTPSSLINETRRKRKIEIFHEKGKWGQGRITNHWPHRPKVFPETPRLWNNAPPNITALPSPVIDRRYWGLIGYH